MPSRRSFISGSSCGRTHWLTRAIHCSKEKGFEITSSKLVTTASPTIVFMDCCCCCCRGAAAGDDFAFEWQDEDEEEEEEADTEEDEDEDEDEHAEAPVRSIRSSRFVARIMGAVKGRECTAAAAAAEGGEEPMEEEEEEEEGAMEAERLGLVHDEPRQPNSAELG